jgi:hypothetical protein
MIYILPASSRKRDDNGKWYFEECPSAEIVIIQRPFHYLSRNAPHFTYEYKKWLFRKLLTSQTAISEFTRMLDILIEEGNLILQCSCVPPRGCHGSVIKEALEWAEPYGIYGWHPELKRRAAASLAKKQTLNA